MAGGVTASAVAERFEEAAETLRRLPDARPGGFRSSWPPIVRSAWEAYGYDPARLPRLAPSPGAISRMEETFAWLGWLEPDEALIVWLRAEGVRWKVIAWRFRIERTTAWRYWVTALVRVANRLNGRGVNERRAVRRNGLVRAAARAIGGDSG